MHCHQILASFYPWFLLHFFPLLLFLATGSRELSNSSRFPTKKHPLNYQKKLWSHPILVYLQLEAPDSKPKVSNLPFAGSLAPPHTQLEDVPETAGKKCQKSLDCRQFWGTLQSTNPWKKIPWPDFYCICLISNAIFQPYFGGVVWILSRDHIWGWGDSVSSFRRKRLQPVASIGILRRLREIRHPPRSS